MKERDWYQKSDIWGLWALGSTYLLLFFVISISVYFDSWIFYPVSFVLIACLQYRLFEGVLHNACHYTLFKTKWMNNAVAPLAAWTGIAGLEDYRRHHLEHHREVGSERDYTQSLYFEEYGLPLDGKMTFRQKLRFWLLAPLSLRPFLSYLKDKITDFSDREEVVLQFLWLIFLIIAWQGNFIFEVFLYWLIPLFFGFSAILYWSEIYDHYRPSAGIARSHIGIISNFIALNDGFHAIHHRHPGIPWFQLPRYYREKGNEFDRDDCHYFFGFLRD